MICIKTKNKKVIKAAKDVAFLLEDERFYYAIRDAKFKGTESSSKDIVKYIKAVLNLEDVVVTTYCKWWANELAVYKSRYPNRVGINACKLRRSHESICGSIVHEIVHLVDEFIEDAEFGHSHRATAGRKETVPYLVGKIAKEIIKEYY